MEDKTVFVIFTLATLFFIGVNCNEATSDETSYLRHLLQNALTIADLEEHIQGLKVKLKKAEVATRSFVRTYRDLKHRIKKIEGTVCGEHEFECGDDKYQCVSELLACDGIKDCNNGRDEDPQFCDRSGYHAGVVYTATAPLSPCFAASRKSFSHTNFIVSVKRNKLLPSRLHVVYKAEARLGDQLISMAGIEGYLQLGTRRAEFYSGAYVARCYFVEDSFDRTYCSSYKFGSEIPCEVNIPLNKLYPDDSAVQHFRPFNAKH